VDIDLRNARLANAALVVAIAVVAIFIGAGCASSPKILAKPILPEPPSAPKARFETLEEAVVSPVTLNANKSDVYQIRQTQPIAIMSFQEARAGSSGSGALVADSIILELQRRGYRVIEREQIDKIRKEQLQIKEGESALSDLEIAKRISQMVAAEYFLIGAVTDYASESRDVSLSKVVVKSDAERYEREYAEFMEKLNTSYASECEKHNKAIAERKGIGERCAPAAKARTLDEWQDEYFNQSRKVFSTVARVGVTAKLVDVNTTKIIWVGQANIADTNLQRGMTRIVSKMVDDFIGQPGQVKR